MKSTAIKIVKNSIYGVIGTSNNGSKFNYGGKFGAEPPEDVYCEFCYNKIDYWFMNTPLGCFKCDEWIKSTDNNFISK